MLHWLNQQSEISQEIVDNLSSVYQAYCKAALENGFSVSEITPLFEQYVKLVIEQVKTPFQFEHFHRRILAPFNYYSFALNFWRPIVDMSRSKVKNLMYVNHLMMQMKRGENVFLFSNHQIEADPIVICLLLEKTHPQLLETMIFVGGHRVREDPLAVPGTKGINILSIYSKRYFENGSNSNEAKLLHNQQSLGSLSQLLAQGGQCIWVAPSGGRDRPNDEKKLDIAVLDPHAIELFYLAGQQCGKKTHFYPLALSTYRLAPPPDAVQMNLGEKRLIFAAPAELAFGPELDMEQFRNDVDKRAEYIYEKIRALGNFPCCLY